MSSIKYRPLRPQIGQWPGTVIRSKFHEGAHPGPARRRVTGMDRTALAAQGEHRSRPATSYAAG